MMPGYTTLPLRAGDDAFCPTLKADSSRSVYLRAGVAPRVGSVEPEPADSEKAEEDERPEHEPCHPLDKVWLPTYPDDNTQDALHTWCTDTGTVRNQGGEEARPRGFWVTLLYRLQRRIEKESRKTGMTAAAAPLGEAEAVGRAASNRPRLRGLRLWSGLPPH